MYGSEKPKGPFTLDQYIAADCEQVKDVMGVYLWKTTGGELCEGCYSYRDGKCPAYQRMAGLLPRRTPIKYNSGETVRQEAERRGVSIKQVRRERRDARAGE